MTTKTESLGGSNTSEPAVSAHLHSAMPGARLFLAALLGGALVASVILLKYAPVPFFWTGVAWALALLAGMFFVKRSWPRAILLNIAIVLLIVASVEAYVALHAYTPPTYPVPLFVPDDLLGWAPIKSHQARGIKPNPQSLFHHQTGLFYDVTYTIDSNGLRIAPPYRKEPQATALFFGCSFTFGDGLKDNETLPFQIAEQSEGRIRTLNFGFQGYSPAQMLAQLEQGIVTRTVDTAPQYAIYVAIPTHVWRVAGRVSWNNGTPRYLLGPDGTVHQEGHLQSRVPLAQRWGLNAHLAGHLKKSSLWQLLSNRDEPITDEDIKLYFAMVRRSRDLLAAQYPNIQFHVILHPAMAGEASRPTYEKLRAGFLQQGYSVTLVEDILPGYKLDRSRYILGPLDAHPSFLSNRLLTQYLLKNVLQQPQPVLLATRVPSDVSDQN